MKALPSVANLFRSDFNKLMRKVDNMNLDVYPSKHFFERVVERDFKTCVVDIFIATCTAYKFFKTTSYDSRTIAVSVSNKKVCFKICINPLSKKRVLVLQTIYNIDDPRCYADEDLKLLNRSEVNMTNIAACKQLHSIRG